MKKSIITFVILLLVLFLSSCSKKDYALRFKNEFNETINNIKAGNAFLGSVAAGETSGYFTFNGQSFIITGTSATGRPLNTTESVSGKGKHRWTITLKSDGSISFSEDAI